MQRPTKMFFLLLLSIAYSQDVINPFHQPNIIFDQLNCYGGGDYDGDGMGQGDYDAALAGIQDDRLDVNGDGLVDGNDAIILQNYINTSIGYLPSWWNFLNREVKVSWLDKMLAIDQTDTNTYVPGEIVSGDFSTILYFHFQGPPKTILEAKTLIATKYDTTNLGRFNIPLYQVALSTPNGAHGMNAVLVGENPLNFYDWQFIEPQYDEYNHFRNFGSNWNPPIGSIIAIRRFTDISKDGENNLFIPVENLVKFEIDSTETPILYGEPNPNLLLTRPTVSIEHESSSPQQYSLENVYPNPTNAEATITYYLSNATSSNITIFDLLGKKVRTLINEQKFEGTHLVKWDGTDSDGSSVSGGIYFIRFQANDFNQTKKLLLLK